MEAAGCPVTLVHLHTKDPELSATQNIWYSLISFVNAVLACVRHSQTFQHLHTLEGLIRNLHVVIFILPVGYETSKKVSTNFPKNLEPLPNSWRQKCTRSNSTARNHNSAVKCQSHCYLSLSARGTHFCRDMMELSGATKQNLVARDVRSPHRPTASLFIRTH